MPKSDMLLSITGVCPPEMRPNWMRTMDNSCEVYTLAVVILWVNVVYRSSLLP